MRTMNDRADMAEARECRPFPYARLASGRAGSGRGQRLAARQAASLRQRDPAFAKWAKGHGMIAHEAATQMRVARMAQSLLAGGAVRSATEVYRCLTAADLVASAAMWLVAHMTYAHNVYLDGRALTARDFKAQPEGHTGGSLNMVPAYVGYLAANALTGVTRSWLMGQGHCVAAIDAVNLLVDNMNPAHADRYAFSDAGLSRFVREFYSYAVGPEGRPESPLGSHVNAHTAGGLIEGGYLGFAELQYVHMPLPGERLVAFLSDGAFEEQRGSDWTARWWRAEDCGLVAPIMILNGRRIEQRSGVAQDGGSAWFREHLRLNGFAPVDLDGRDPAAFAAAILEMEEGLAAGAAAVSAGKRRYPLAIPYGIAATPKGFGFPGAGTLSAHNLPLAANPRDDDAARAQFNTGAKKLHVAPELLRSAIRALATHERQSRPRERDHALARRNVALPLLPAPRWREKGGVSGASPMEAIDLAFCDIVQANPGLRPRVGNPDELRSNRMSSTLDLLKHRVAEPEPGIAEAITGAVITALNEEAVVCAALANKGGINIVVSYEAFAVKMLGAIRQELVFARNLRQAGRPAGWLSVPVVVTSHTWENGKNEQSHQDPTFCEALLGEMSDVSRVLFPADWNSAAAALRAAYSTKGQVWTLAVPKRPVPFVFSPAQADDLARTGAAVVSDPHAAPQVLLAASGAYQLIEALKAERRLSSRGIATRVIYIQEPGRMRRPRDLEESRFCLPESAIAELFPAGIPRVFVTHTRPEPYIGIVRRLDPGAARAACLGYANRGGTLDVGGMLFANRCTWAHAVAEVAGLLGRNPESLLSAGEWAAVRGIGSPAAIHHELLDRPVVL